MLGVEALIVFAVASFHFAVVPRRICTDLLVYYSVYAKYSLEQCRIRLSAFVVPKIFGKFLPIVRLHTFNRELKVLNRMLQKYCGGMAAVLLKRFQIALSRELVYAKMFEPSLDVAGKEKAFERFCTLAEEQGIERIHEVKYFTDESQARSIRAISKRKSYI